jgi:Protein of unknown function (DUF4236)
MGWFFRKSLRLLPGIRLNLSKSGPRSSAGVPGVRASIDLKGKTRLYAGKGPIRFQKTLNIAKEARCSDRGRSFVDVLRTLIARW